MIATIPDSPADGYCYPVLLLIAFLYLIKSLFLSTTPLWVKFLTVFLIWSFASAFRKIPPTS